MLGHNTEIMNSYSSIPWPLVWLGSVNPGMGLKHTTLRRWRSNSDAFPTTGSLHLESLCYCVSGDWALRVRGQRKVCHYNSAVWEMPQKDTAALLSHAPSNHNNGRGGRGVTLAEGNGMVICGQWAKIQRENMAAVNSEVRESFHTTEGLCEEDKNMNIILTWNSRAYWDFYCDWFMFVILIQPWVKPRLDLILGSSAHLSWTYFKYSSKFQLIHPPWLPPCAVFSLCTHRPWLLPLLIITTPVWGLCHVKVNRCFGVNWCCWYSLSFLIVAKLVFQSMTLCFHYYSVPLYFFKSSFFVLSNNTLIYQCVLIPNRPRKVVVKGLVMKSWKKSSGNRERNWTRVAA